MDKSKGQHGELKACGWSFWENGMSMYSHAESSMDLKIGEDGGWQLTDRKQSDMEGETVRVYRVDPSIPQRIRELSDREDLPAWSEWKYENDPRFQVLDYSSESTISLVYDDSAVGGSSSERFGISPKAARQHGGEAVIDEFMELLRSCRRDDMLVSEKKKGPSNKIRKMFMGLGGGKDAAEPEAKAGPDVCPSCGYRPVEGKFCPECGSRMPGR